VEAPPPPPERDEVDGVPVHWAELPGPFGAALMFRAGRCDEPFGSLGICHLVEHLALYGLGRPAFMHNGFVDLTRTAFYASGSREEVAGFLRDVCAALGALPLDRLEDERRVLRTEAAADAGGFYGRLLAHRFGAAGAGLVNYEDLGLTWLDAETVAAWAAARYTRGNAVLWMSGPPFEELELPLADGERVPLAPAVQLPCFTEPLELAEGAGGVGVSMVGRRSTALNAAMRLAAERAIGRVRLEQGLSYSIGTDYLRLDGEHAHTILSADCLDDHAVKVRDGLLGVLDALASGEATDDEIALDRRRFHDAMAEPDWMRTILDAAATDDLHGWPSLSPAELLAEHEALTAADISETLSAALATRLVVSPERVPPPAGHAPYVGAPEEPVAGREFAPRRGITGRRAGHRVIAGDDGVTLLDSDSGPTTVRFAGMAGAVRGAPGEVTLVGRDGTFIRLTFRAWSEGDELERLIMGRLPHPGAVPGPEFEAARAVQAIAERDLSLSWSVSDELEGLPGLLGDGEALEHLARASRGHRAGLLAVTGRRVLWLYSSVRRGRDDMWEAPRDAIRGVKSWAGIPGVAEPRLRLRTGEEELKLTGVAPRRKLGELVDALAVSS
jgi:predicted Zn-dependent peptidase